MILNLLNNAKKFTKDGKINITVLRKKNAEQVIVSIVDKGKGINSEVMNHLFEKFITESDSGTGLGLYISKNIVEAHGGKSGHQTTRTELVVPFPSLFLLN